MNRSEIARVEAYLRTTIGNAAIRIDPPKKRGAPIEVMIGGEFIGVIHRDDDEGEISYSLLITILEEDLPKLAAGS
jgi:hypothetical protein